MLAKVDARKSDPRKAPRETRDPRHDAADAVRRYAAAKSRQDVAGALAVCTDDFVLDTVGFGIRGVGRETVAAQLGIFFTTFPDYAVTIDGEAVSDDTTAVTCWGTWRATMRGALGTFAATNAACAVPFVCVCEIRDGRLAAERFFFDVAALCEQLNLPVAAVVAELRAFRDVQGASSAAGSPYAGGIAPAEFVARFTAAWQQPVDVANLGALLHPDVRLIAPGMPETVGRGPGVEAFRQVFVIVPDFHIDVERWSVSGDAVFLEVTMRGTINGHAVVIPSVDRILLRDGLVVERVAFFDPTPMVTAMNAAA